MLSPHTRSTEWPRMAHLQRQNLLPFLPPSPPFPWPFWVPRIMAEIIRKGQLQAYGWGGESSRVWKTLHDPSSGFKSKGQRSSGSCLGLPEVLVISSSSSSSSVSSRPSLIFSFPVQVSCRQARQDKKKQSQRHCQKEPGNGERSPTFALTSLRGRKHMAFAEKMLEGLLLMVEVPVSYDIFKLLQHSLTLVRKSRRRGTGRPLPFTVTPLH